MATYKNLRKVLNLPTLSESPSSGVNGEMYFNTTDSALYIYDGAWKKVTQQAIPAAFFDASNGSYANKTFNISSQESEPYALKFSPDGTKMWAAGIASDRIFLYNLSTAHDVSTASYSNVNFNYTSQDTTIQWFDFNPTGTKMYLVAWNNKKIHQYSLSTAFDISTASSDSVNYLTTSQDAMPVHFGFNDTGTKMYMLGAATKKIYQYSLSTAFNVGTASYDSVLYVATAQESNPNSFTFNSDGTKMYILGTTQDAIFEYDLSTGFDLTTVSYNSSSMSVQSQVTVPNGLTFSNDFSKAYIINASGVSGQAAVYQYS